MEGTMSIRRRLGALIAGAVLGVGGAVLAAAGPAHAAPPDVWGFAYSHDPAPPPGTVLDPTRQWGSWKTAFPADFATVDHIGIGEYLVRFPHIATTGGVAHVTAVLGTGPAWCQLGKWFPSGGDEYVEVRCYRHGGTPDDTRFAIVFSSKAGPLVVPGGGYAYVHADPAAALIDSYNSAGAPNAAGVGGPGFYKVYLPGVGTPGGFAGNIQVTAAEPGVPRRCKVADVAAAGTDIYVWVSCVDGSSLPADSTFTLTYHRERSVFGELAPPKRFGYVLNGTWAPPPGTNFNSAGAANLMIPSGPGQTLVVFRQLGVRETHTEVTAVGGKPDYCALQDVWRTFGSDGLVRNVICFDVTGAQADNASFVTFSSRV
jgi:hypothetical protein